MKITQRGFNTITKRLEELKVQLPQVSAEVKRTAAQGDLRENWGYTSAIEDWTKCNKEISYLNSVLERVTSVISKNTVKNQDIIQFGAHVQVSYQVSNDNIGLKKQLKFSIVSQDELQYVEGGFSEQNPFVQHLIGLEQGSKFHINNKEFFIDGFYYED